MKTIYQVVSTTAPAVELDRAAFEAAYKIENHPEGKHLRPELRGEPVIADHCGPMWGGWRDEDGEHIFLTDDRDPASPHRPYSPSKKPVAAKVIRYETWSAYEAYSR